MRKHLLTLTASAAALLFAGASAAGASTTATPATTGATVSTLYTAGYQATGRDFRFAQAGIQVPDRYSGLNAPIEYAALESGDSDAGAGVMSCALAHYIEPSYTCSSGTWAAFAGTFNSTLSGLRFSFQALPGVNAGDQLFVSTYFNAVGDSLHYVITTPGVGGINPVPGHTYYFSGRARGAIYNEAVALDDWTFTPVKPSLSLIGHSVNSFGNGRFTTQRGNQGTFVGPWTTSAVDLTSNGLGAGSGTVIISPTPLSSDGVSFKGLGSDSFTVEHGGTS